MGNEIAVYEGAPAPLTVSEIRGQVNLIQDVMKQIMVRDEHYGIIPGTGNKPTLLKAGAEKLIFTFRLVPDIDEQVIELPNAHREYRVKVKMYAMNGTLLGAGVGSCSTMEGKFRFRTGPTELTETPVPKEYWDIRKSNPGKAQALLGGKGFSTKKNDAGQWMIAIQGEKVEHDNPADYYNTCLKMAKKRALVDACLTVTAASDIFTQDIEDMPEVIPGAAVSPKSESPVPSPSGKTDSPEQQKQDAKNHWCSIHNTAYFMKGKMQAYAHPIEGQQGKWCTEPKLKEEEKADPMPVDEFKTRLKTLGYPTQKAIIDLLQAENWESVKAVYPTHEAILDAVSEASGIPWRSLVAEMVE
jgi:hypothetical protein